MNREPLEIKFIIDAPHTDYQSDFNTLILRMEKLRKFYDNVYNDIAQSNINIDTHNRNIECMQEILEKMKFKTIEM